MRIDEKKTSKAYYKYVKLVNVEYKKSSNWSNQPGWDLTFADEEFVYSHFQLTPDYLWKIGKKAAYKEAKTFMTKLCTDGRDPRKDIGNWYKVKAVARDMGDSIYYNVDSIIRKIDPLQEMTIIEKDLNNIVIGENSNEEIYQ